ncbi:unnamed protein product [[Actinomadura] parvosata subsp. kistnae]|nr:unnamed protein product [Actinomadura parvosata subsp. kistnae]
MVPAAPTHPERGAAVVSLPSGPVEYRLEADGPRTVVVFHGGHMRAGSALGEEAFAVAGCSVLAPSRPGYGRTPLTDRHHGRRLRRRHPQLCRVLGIDRLAAVVGISAGGRTALSMAARTWSSGSSCKARSGSCPGRPAGRLAGWAVGRCSTAGWRPAPGASCDSCSARHPRWGCACYCLTCRSCLRARCCGTCPRLSVACSSPCSPSCARGTVSSPTCSPYRTAPRRSASPHWLSRPVTIGRCPSPTPNLWSRRCREPNWWSARPTAA